MNAIVLSAGGTGGHLFPAQALAVELARRGRKIVVMTDARGKNYGAAFPGAEIETVPSASFADRGVIGKLLAPLEIAAGVGVAIAKLTKIKPAAIVGFGGYPSLPVMIAGALTGYPTAVHEQNAVLGKVNRLVASRVRKIAASFPLARFAPQDQSRIAFTGNPVRPAVVKLAAAPYGAPTDTGPLKLLVFGGSQGARALSELVPAAIAGLAPDMRARLEIVQQCRPEDLEEVRRAYHTAQVDAELSSFFNDMPQRIADAHLVIARSGASSISELTVIGRPALLVPFPFATDDHQTANADVLAMAGAAWAIQQRDLTADRLTGLLASIFSKPDELARRAAAALALGKPNAASRLADLVEALSGGRIK